MQRTQKDSSRIAIIVFTAILLLMSSGLVVPFSTSYSGNSTNTKPTYIATIGDTRVSSGFSPTVAQSVIIGRSPITETQQQSVSSFSTVTAAIPGLWLDSSKKRTRSQIYIEILELMKRGPMTPFEIAFYARLNRKRTKDYAEFLSRTGYLNEEVETETGKKVYVLTRDGFLFLERVKTLFERNRSSTDIVFTEIAKNLERN